MFSFWLQNFVRNSVAANIAHKKKSSENVGGFHRVIGGIRRRQG